MSFPLQKAFYDYLIDLPLVTTTAAFYSGLVGGSIAGGVPLGASVAEMTADAVQRYVPKSWSSRECAWKHWLRFLAERHPEIEAASVDSRGARSTLAADMRAVAAYMITTKNLATATAGNYATAIQRLLDFKTDDGVSYMQAYTKLPPHQQAIVGTSWPYYVAWCRLEGREVPPNFLRAEISLAGAYGLLGLLRIPVPRRLFVHCTWADLVPLVDGGRYALREAGRPNGTWEPQLPAWLVLAWREYQGGDKVRPLGLLLPSEPGGDIPMTTAQLRKLEEAAHGVISASTTADSPQKRIEDEITGQKRAAQPLGPPGPSPIELARLRGEDPNVPPGIRLAPTRVPTATDWGRFGGGPVDPNSTEDADPGDDE